MSNVKEEQYTKAYRRYRAGFGYNNKIKYYATVSENNDYLIGEQWGNVPQDQPIATFNFEKMIQRYKTAAISSQRLSAVYTAESISDDTNDQSEQLILDTVALMSGAAEQMWEKQKMDFLIRKFVADAWVSGDMCAFCYWDSYAKTGQPFDGEIKTERFSGGNVFFGNPNIRDAQLQPYIVLLSRETVYDLKLEAKRLGLNQKEIDKIGGDLDTETQVGKYGNTELEGDDEFAKCNVYYTLERDEKGIAHWSKSTNSVDIRKDTSLRMKRYPVAWGVWEDVEYCYHGRAESTGIHPAQRFVNKMYALCMMWMINNSLGKIAFDETLISNWSNDLGTAIPVNGNPNNVIQQLRSGDFNNAILQVIDSAINYTRDFCGVTSAALGQGRADNTSAIVALGKQAEISLENQQNNVKQFIEDIYLIWADMMLANYVTGRKLPIKENGVVVYKEFNDAMKDKIIANVKIEVGASSIWSELSSQTTLDNMLQNQVINQIQYLERLPEGTIVGLKKLIEEKKEELKSQNKATTPIAGEQDFEAMAQFMDTLPKETQIALKSMPPDQMQQEVIALMNQQNPQGQGGEANGMQGNSQEVDLQAMIDEMNGGGTNG